MTCACRLLIAFGVLLATDAEALYSNRFYLYIVNTSVTPAAIVDKCEGLPAEGWGQEIPDDGVEACAVQITPLNGCSGTISPTYNSTQQYSVCMQTGGAFALAERGNCSFGEKAWHAQQSSYQGLIVSNFANESGPVKLGADGHYSDKVIIPVFSISHSCGKKLASNFTYQRGYMFLIHSVYVIDLTKYLLPFVIILGICILIMFAAMVVKCYRERRQVTRRRLSKRNLRKIPTRKYKKGSEPDTCAICLEEFIEGDKLRVLPCNHEYHTACVDPWLTKNRKVCPVCKRKVLPKSADSSSDDDNNSARPERSGNEREPLLGSPPGSSREIGNSTFYTSYDSLAPTDGGAATASTSISIESLPEFSPGTSSSINGGGEAIGDESGDKAFLLHGNVRRIPKRKKQSRSNQRASRASIVRSEEGDNDSSITGHVFLQSDADTPTTTAYDNPGYLRTDRDGQLAEVLSPAASHDDSVVTTVGAVKAQKSSSNELPNV